MLSKHCLTALLLFSKLTPTTQLNFQQLSQLLISGLKPDSCPGSDYMSKDILTTLKHNKYGKKTDKPNKNEVLKDTNDPLHHCAHCAQYPAG